MVSVWRIVPLLATFVACTATTRSGGHHDTEEPRVAAALEADAETPRQGKRRALLVGVGDYLHDADGFSDLEGPRYDVANMRALLVERFQFRHDEIHVLRDAEATRDGILAAFREHLVEGSDGETVAVFYFSGHGGQVRDADGDEADGLDETLMPYDTGRKAAHENRDVTDDELNALLTELSARAAAVTQIVDSCHSGASTRGSVVARSGGGDEVGTDRRPLLARPPVSAAHGGAEGASGQPSGARWTLIAAARADQRAHEYNIDGHVQGALTWALTGALREMGPGATYRDVMDLVRKRVEHQLPSQSPQLEGAGLDNLVLGTTAVARPHYHLVSELETGVFGVAGGAVHGLAVGSLLDVYPLGGEITAATGAIARLRVERVGGTTSRATCVSDACALPPAARAVERTRPVLPATVRVWIEPTLPVALELAKMLADFPLVTVTGDAHAYDFAIVSDRPRSPTSLRAEARDGSASTAFLPLGAPAVVEEATKRVIERAKWHSVGKLVHDNGALKAKLTVPGNPKRGGERTFGSGDSITFEVANEGAERLYLHVFAVGDDGEIMLLFPLVGGAQEALEPGRTWSHTVRAAWPEGWHRETIANVIKVFVSREATDLSFFSQPPFTRGSKSAARGRSSLERVFRAVTGTRGAAPVEEGVDFTETDAWRTLDAVVVTARD